MGTRSLSCPLSIRKAVSPLSTEVSFLLHGSITNSYLAHSRQESLKFRSRQDLGEHVLQGNNSEKLRYAPQGPTLVRNSTRIQTPPCPAPTLNHYLVMLIATEGFGAHFWNVSRYGHKGLCALLPLALGGRPPPESPRSIKWATLQGLRKKLLLCKFPSCSLSACLPSERRA